MRYIDGIANDQPRLVLIFHHVDHHSEGGGRSVGPRQPIDVRTGSNSVSFVGRQVKAMLVGLRWPSAVGQSAIPYTHYRWYHGGRFRRWPVRLVHWAVV